MSSECSETTNQILSQTSDSDDIHHTNNGCTYDLVLSSSEPAFLLNVNDGNLFSPITSGIVYSILYERVLKDKIPYYCKERLKGLTENDSISSPAADDRALFNLRRHYPTESIISMAPQLCRNIAMDVYQRERASEWTTVSVIPTIQFRSAYSIHKLDDRKVTRLL